jgi:hypothetical protein
VCTCLKGGGDRDRAPVGVVLDEGEGVPFRLLPNIDIEGELSMSVVDVFVDDDVVVIVVSDEDGVDLALTLGEDVPLVRPPVTGDLSARS